MEDSGVARKITLALKVFAWVSAVVGFVVFLGVLIFGGGPQASKTTSLIFLVLGFAYFVFLYAAAEVIALLVRIEKNTRRPEPTLP